MSRGWAVATVILIFLVLYGVDFLYFDHQVRALAAQATGTHNPANVGVYPTEAMDRLERESVHLGRVDRNRRLMLFAAAILAIAVILLLPRRGPRIEPTPI
jgi:hypothetical protein